MQISLKIDFLKSSRLYQCRLDDVTSVGVMVSRLVCKFGQMGHITSYECGVISTGSSRATVFPAKLCVLLHAYQNCQGSVPPYS